MTLETIRALYTARDEASRQLSDANYDLDTHLLWNVRALAEKVRPIGGSERLAKRTDFDSETGLFTCWVESYCGEGNWEIDWNGEEQEEDREDVESSRILIPARWLDQSQEDALAEHATQQAEKQALREARETEEAEQERKEQEAHERSLLEQLQAKYKGVSP